MADQRDLLSHRVERLLAQPRVAGRNQAKDRYQDKEQREHRHEGGMGEVPGQRAPVVVPVLLDDPEHERGRLMALLNGINPADRSLDRVHPARPPVPASVPHQSCPQAPYLNEAGRPRRDRHSQEPVGHPALCSRPTGRPRRGASGPAPRNAPQ